MKLGWVAAAASDVGRVRQGNEDAFLIDAPRGVFLVADGMGGHAAGEVASAVATEAVGTALRAGVDLGLQADGLAEALRRSFRLAHGAILDYTAANPAAAGMGTTMTAIVVCDDGTFRLGHIGDSRAYLLRDGVLGQITHDHTWVQREVDEGRLSPRGARTHRFAHILTRALGADSTDEPDVYSGVLRPGDVLLLATDGLTGMLTDRRLARTLAAAERPVEEMVAELVFAANRRGGRDNITAVVVRVHESTAGADDTVPEG
ncbi:MAG TPA: protein phosphatase 2C domain-containing protein [Longimicrobiaceae bacterium]|nr:protein phosphatase 2C domain-containing protein [Longimicrobiaceae bacterium]